MKETTTYTPINDIIDRYVKGIMPVPLKKDTEPEPTPAINNQTAQNYQQPQMPNLDPLGRPMMNPNFNQQTQQNMEQPQVQYQQPQEYYPSFNTMYQQQVPQQPMYYGGYYYDPMVAYQQQLAYQQQMAYWQQQQAMMMQDYYNPYMNQPQPTGLDNVVPKDEPSNQPQPKVTPIRVNKSEPKPETQEDRANFNNAMNDLLNGGEITPEMIEAMKGVINSSDTSRKIAENNAKTMQELANDSTYRLSMAALNKPNVEPGKVYNPELVNNVLQDPTKYEFRPDNPNLVNLVHKEENNPQSTQQITDPSSLHYSELEKGIKEGATMQTMQQQPTQQNMGMNMNPNPEIVNPFIAHMQQQQVGFNPMFSNPNIMNQAYNQFAARMEQAQMPNMGQQPMPYTPGMVSTPQFEDANGNTMNANTPFNQPNGYNLLHDNPVNPNPNPMMNNPYYYPNQQIAPNTMGNPTQMQGGQQSTIPFLANPYSTFGYNPMANAIGRNPYYNPYMANTYNPYVYGMTYAQNEFNTFLQDILYSEKPIDNDPNWLASVMLSDQEKEKISRERNQAMYVTGTDYFGNPIYGYPYMDNRKKQEEFENARKAYQDHFVMLSRIAHAYTGEEFDEEKARAWWDPMRIINQNNPVYKSKYDLSTEEGRLEQAKDLRLDQTAELFRQMDIAAANREMAFQQRGRLFDMVKASHDRMLGFEPGQHYTLGEYMNNGYNLLYGISTENAIKYNRQHRQKYDQDAYINRMNMRVAARDALHSALNSTKDDDYVSIEEKMRHQYYGNKSQQPQSLFIGGNGSLKYTSPTENLMNDEAFKKFYDICKQKENDVNVKKEIRKNESMVKQGKFKSSAG